MTIVSDRQGTPLRNQRLEALDRHVYASGTSQLEVVSPITGEPFNRVPESSTDDVRQAFHFARAAQRTWQAHPPSVRARILRRFHDLVLQYRDEALDITQVETGKARKDALEELIDIANTTRYYTRIARKVLKPRRASGAVPGLVGVTTYHRPKGVVGVIAPWNYPLTLAATDAVAALMAGNAVVLKPDSKTPTTALWVADMLERAGLPQGLFTVVVGGGSTLGPVMIEESDYMMFTGSTRVGRLIAAGCGERLIGCSLELGGKNALVILDDADIDKAVDVTVRGSFANSGQLCISVERVYVPVTLWDAYVSKLAAAVTDMRLQVQVGWGADMGSLIDAGQLSTVTGHIDDAVSKGARVLAGGRPRPELGPFAHEPTVLVDVPESAVVCRNETFGPVISLYPYRTESEAIAAANDTEYGLQAVVVSGSLSRAKRAAAVLKAGTVSINEGYAISWGSVRTPMGGMGDSGLGRRHGPEGLLKYTESQSVATMRALSFSPQFGMDDQQFGKLLSTYMKVAGSLRLK